MTDEENSKCAQEPMCTSTGRGSCPMPRVDMLPDVDMSRPDGGPRRPPDPHDDVCHPLRYTKGLVECIDAIDSAVTGKPPEEAVCVANIVKYLWRYEEKEPVRSLLSAEWYLKRLIEKVRRRTVAETRQ